MEHIYKNYKISYTPPYFTDSMKKRILCFALKNLKWNIISNFVKAVFHKFYLVCSSILCLICSGAKQYYLFNISSINMKWNSKQSPVLLRNSYYETSEEPQIIPKFCFLKLYNTDPITFLQFSKFSEQHPLN